MLMRGQVTKVDIVARIMKLKSSLYNGHTHHDWSEDQKHSAQCALSEVLDVLQEYRL